MAAFELQRSVLCVIGQPHIDRPVSRTGLSFFGGVEAQFPASVFLAIHHKKMTFLHSYPIMIQVLTIGNHIAILQSMPQFPVSYCLKHGQPVQHSLGHLVATVFVKLKRFSRRQPALQ